MEASVDYLVEDLDNSLFDANRNVVARSLWQHIEVFADPEQDELTLICERLPRVESLPAGYGLFLDVEPASGRIAGLTVLGYQSELFALAPILGHHLAAYNAAVDAQTRQEFGLRLFHGLLMVASPVFAEQVRQAYTAAQQRVDGVASLLAQVRQAMDQLRFDDALDRLANVVDQRAHDLRANILLRKGERRSAMIESRQGYRLAPPSGHSFFGPWRGLHLTPAWQTPPSADSAGVKLEVIDAHQPERQIWRGEPQQVCQLSDEGGAIRFSLRLRLPVTYASYACRIFIVDEELRDELGLSDADLRQAFAYHGEPIVTELEHVLVVHSAVLTDAGDFLGGVVAADGWITIQEWLPSLGLPSEQFFFGKTVVVLLFDSMPNNQ